MTKLDSASETQYEQIHYEQGQSIVHPKSTPDLVRFAADVLREKAHDPYTRALADELYKRAEEIESPAKDWTVDLQTGRSNSSPEFLRLSAEVGRIIRDDAHRLLAGRAADTGGLVMAQLAHKQGLAPRRGRR